MKQSPLVLALFLGSASAVSLSWAEGMKGDEDLGQDITMKGQKYHYAQAEPAFNANQGAEKVHELIPGAYQTVANTNQPGPRTTFYSQQPSALVQTDAEWDANMGAEGVHELIPESYRTQSNLADGNILSYPEGGQRTAFYVQTGENWSANDQPEKVSVTETVWAPGHTTYYS
jgi:hypothetical protein